jgi:hypothetical protein
VDKRDPGDCPPAGLSGLGPRIDHRLDGTWDADQRRLFVYFVKNGAAVQLVDTLRGVFGIADGYPKDGAGISRSTKAGKDTRDGEAYAAKDNPRAAFHG